jgi:hypothetical protein
MVSNNECNDWRGTILMSSEETLEEWEKEREADFEKWEDRTLFWSAFLIDNWAFNPT